MRGTDEQGKVLELEVVPDILYFHYDIVIYLNPSPLIQWKMS